MSTISAGEWDARYREQPLLWSAGPNRFVEEDLSSLDPGSALDVACGEGRNSVWLAEQGWRVTGVDFSAVALERARKMASERRVSVEWVEADVTTWEPGSVFDLVVVAYVHVPPPMRLDLMQRSVRWVAPGGHLFLVGHDTATCGVSGPSDPDLLWDPDTAAAAVHPLTVIHNDRRPRPLDNGDLALDTVLLATNSEGGP